MHFGYKGHFETEKFSIFKRLVPKCDCLRFTSVSGTNSIFYLYLQKIFFIWNYLFLQ